MKKLLNSLNNLKKFGVNTIKKSFEDEGANVDEIKLVKNLAYKVGLKLNVKIGGCEAKNDIINCQKINVNGIIAPMIETPFAFKKFIHASSKVTDISLFINIESKTGLLNLKDILSMSNISLLEGIIIGRSDLVSSFGYSPDYVDSKKIFEKITDALKNIKRKNLKTKIGGNLTYKSIEIVKYLYEKNLIDAVETRNVEIPVNRKTLKNMKDIISDSLGFEILFLDYLKSYQSNIYKELDNRQQKIKDRIV